MFGSDKIKSPNKKKSLFQWALSDSNNNIQNPHIIVEDLIPPAVVEMVGILVRDKFVKQLKLIPLSNFHRYVRITAWSKTNNFDVQKSDNLPLNLYFDCVANNNEDGNWCFT